MKNPKNPKINNIDIFLHFVQYVKTHTVSEIVNEFGGSYCYIPKLLSIRNAVIKSEYDMGVSITQLSSQYCLSNISIRRILREKNLENTKRLEAKNV